MAPWLLYTSACFMDTLWKPIFILSHCVNVLSGQWEHHCYHMQQVNPAARLQSPVTPSSCRRFSPLASLLDLTGIVSEKVIPCLSCLKHWGGDSDFS